MVAGKSSRVNRQYKKKYRIRNWREYERGLRSRGDGTIWLSEDAIAAWVPHAERSSRRPAAALEPRGPDRVDPAGRLQPAAPPDRGVHGAAAELTDRAAGTTPPHSLLFSTQSRFQHPAFHRRRRAYDHRSVYDQLSAAGTENVVICDSPSRHRSAVSAGPTDGPWAQRDNGS